VSAHAFVRPGQVAPDLPAPDACVRCGLPAAAHGPGAEGPFETERQVAELPAVRAVYEAFDRDPGVGKMAPHSRRLLGRALEAAGVGMGRYDDRIAEWLCQWEPHTVAVVAGWVTRARRPDPAAAQLAAIRAVFDVFDWETDDRQYALEQIEDIVRGAS